MVQMINLLQARFWFVYCSFQDLNELDAMFLFCAIAGGKVRSSQPTGADFGRRDMVSLLQRRGHAVHRCATAHHQARPAVKHTPSPPIPTSDQGTHARTHTHRYGIRAFDTSPFYGNSEIVLGTALKVLEPEFPRATYQLNTKVGRYGPTDFDYSPEAVRRSVRRSLQRLHTQYLDVVYLHDVEFVAPRPAGSHVSAGGAEAAAYGVASSDQEHVSTNISGPCDGEDTVRSAGDGDERVLAAISALRSLQADGLIRHVGICGTVLLLPPDSR
jgi:Aldo/keto reductase family